MLFTLIGGGAAGSILTILYNKYQNQKQSIKYEIISNSIFHPNSELKNSVCLNIYNEEGSSVHDYYNLFLVILKIKNIGNKDFEKFEFGVNIKGNKEVIKIEYETIDRQHELKLDKEISFNDTSDEIDISLDPFNREEEYLIRFFIATVTSGQDDDILAFKETDFELSSKHPIRFTKVENRKNQKNWKDYLLAQLPMIALILATGAYFSSKIKVDSENRLNELIQYHEVNSRQLDSLKYFENRLKEQQDSIEAFINKMQNDN